jgi:O-antigen/teichoic acid export membrane protein
MNPLLIYEKPVTLTFFRGISAAILLIYGILVARAMGPSGFGAYSYIMVLVFFGGTIADFGTDRVLLREIGRDLISWRTNWIKAAAIRTAFGLVLLLLSGLMGGF